MFQTACVGSESVVVFDVWQRRSMHLLLSSCRYTLFYNSERTGEPVMKPLWVDFPADKSTFKIEDVHLVGSLASAFSAANCAVSVEKNF